MNLTRVVTAVRNKPLSIGTSYHNTESVIVARAEMPVAVPGSQLQACLAEFLIEHGSALNRRCRRANMLVSAATDTHG